MSTKSPGVFRFYAASVGKSTMVKWDVAGSNSPPQLLTASEFQHVACSRFPESDSGLLAITFGCADDHELIDENWLRTVADRGEAIRARFWLNVSEDRKALIYPHQEGAWQIDFYDVHERDNRIQNTMWFDAQIKTRGQLRQLASILNFQCASNLRK